MSSVPTQISGVFISNQDIASKLLTWLAWSVCISLWTSHSKFGMRNNEKHRDRDLLLLVGNLCYPCTVWNVEYFISERLNFLGVWQFLSNSICRMDRANINFHNSKFACTFSCHLEIDKELHLVIPFLNENFIFIFIVIFSHIGWVKYGEAVTKITLLNNWPIDQKCGDILCKSDQRVPTLVSNWVFCLEVY